HSLHSAYPDPVVSSGPHPPRAGWPSARRRAHTCAWILVRDVAGGLNCQMAPASRSTVTGLPCSRASAPSTARWPCPASRMAWPSRETSIDPNTLTCTDTLVTIQSAKCQPPAAAGYELHVADPLPGKLSRTREAAAVTTVYGPANQSLSESA